MAKAIRSPFRFASRGEARKAAVEAPDDAAALISTVWPPASREELACLSKVARRAGVLPDRVLSAYVSRRVERLQAVLRHREIRDRSDDIWTAPARNGRVLRFPLCDDIGHRFKAMIDEYGGDYEKPLIDFLAARLGSDAIFADIGAHVGYISAHAAASGACVFAVEIQRDLIPLIERMATINGFDLIRAVHAGASSASGLSMLQRIEAHPGVQLETETVLNTPMAPHSIVNDFVPMLALDDLFADPRIRPTLVKIDVEGHEIGVLEGAAALIAAAATTFVVEYHPHLVRQYGRHPAELLAHFPAARWRISQLDDTGLRPISAIEDVREDPRDPNPKLVMEPM
jgi:FkbM family methyltransferase